MFIVEMCGGEPYTAQYRYFCCHGKVWDQLLDLAKNWGWEPEGTTLDQMARNFMREQTILEFNGDYHPEDFAKTVSERDGSAMAGALERASKQPLPEPAQKPLSIREGMTGEQYRMANADISGEMLNEFAGFLRKGAFAFFWDD
jgi:hypothetical protein